MPTSPEASLRPPSSLRGRLGAGLRAASGRGDFPCFHPAFTLCPAGCSCSCRSSRPTSRSSSRWAPPSPPPRGTPAGFKSTDRQTNARPKSAGARAAPPPQLRLCPPPSAPPPQLHLARRSGGMPGTCVYGRDGRTPSISHQSPLYLPSISPRSPLDLRREINAELQVQACHPNAKAAARRCPVALFQFFTDSPDLYVDGNLADAFK